MRDFSIEGDNGRMHFDSSEAKLQYLERQLDQYNDNFFPIMQHLEGLDCIADTSFSANHPIVKRIFRAKQALRGYIADRLLSGTGADPNSADRL